MTGIENGTRYIIRNVKGETVLDLNGSDGRTSKSSIVVLLPISAVSIRGLIAPLEFLVIGFPRHGGENQQWQTIYTEGGWHIKSVGTDKYLNLEHSPRDDVRLVATQQPFTWHLWDDDKVPNAIRYGLSHRLKTVVVK